MSEFDDILLDEFKERELEILALMADGHTNVEIGEKLFVTRETVRWYNKQIYSKLGTSRRTEAIAKAKRLGLIGESPTSVIGQSSPILKHNLPTFSTPFIGREENVAKISEILAQPYTPLLTILGPGGMGKTRLAIEAGHQLMSTYTDGVYLFELAPLKHANQILTAALQALRISSKGIEDARQLLFKHCRDKRLLLIFDNFEHILDGAELVDSLLKEAPSCRVLVTSRERLNLYGETVLELDGLMQNGERLFVANAQTLLPDFTLQEEDKPHMQRIVQLVGGLPLGIILAAAWADTLDVDEIADEISQDLDMLSTDMRNIPERQRSMRTVLSSSWLKLTQSERQACMKLAIFKGGFSRRAATKIANASIHILQRLQHKSFVQLVAERRYDWHPLVQQYVLEQWNESDQLSATRSSHLHYFHAFVTDTLRPLQYGDYIYPLKEVEAEHENIHLALDWGLAQSGDIHTVATELVVAMAPFWDNRSYNQEGLHYASVAVKRMVESKMWAQLMRIQQRFLRQMARFADARETARRVYDYAETQSDIEVRLMALSAVTNTLFNEGDLKELLTMAERFWEESQASGNGKYIRSSLFALATAYEFAGDIDRSLEMAQQLLQLYREAEDDLEVARISYNMGLTIYNHQNAPQEAKQLFEESLALKRLIGDRRGIMTRLSALSNVSVILGQPAESMRYLQEAEQLAGDIDAPARVMWVYYSWAFHYESQADWSKAIEKMNVALEIARQIDHSRGRGQFGLGLARYYVSNNLYNQALHHLRVAVKIAVDNDITSIYPDSLLTFAHYWLAAGDVPKCGLVFVHYEQIYESEPSLFFAVDFIQKRLTETLSSDRLDQLRAELLSQEPRSLIVGLLGELPG